MANPFSTTIPGSAFNAPNQTNRNIQALITLLPQLTEAVTTAQNNAILPQARAQLLASKETSPEYAQLMSQMLSIYGPQLSDIGNILIGKNMTGYADVLTNLLKGSGGAAATAANDLQQQLQMKNNPEYYATRKLESSRLADLLNSIDLSGNLSTTENRQISQSLAQDAARRGTQTAPSNTETVANAMQFGNAGTQRKTLAQNQLASAINAATSFLPQSNTGAQNAFQIATAGASSSNPGLAMFTGINTPSTQTGATGLGSQLFSGLTGMTTAGTQDMTSIMNNLISQANENHRSSKDFLDQIGQGVGILSNLYGGGSSGGIGKSIFG